MAVAMLRQHVVVEPRSYPITLAMSPSISLTRTTCGFDGHPHDQPRYPGPQRGRQQYAARRVVVSASVGGAMTLGHFRWTMPVVLFARPVGPGVAATMTANPSGLYRDRGRVMEISGFTGFRAGEVIALATLRDIVRRGQESLFLQNGCRRDRPR